MSSSLVQVILNLADAGGNPLNRGMVAIAPSVVLTGSAPTPGEIPQAPVAAQLVGTAWPSVSLLPTDTPGVLPSGWGYTTTYITVPGNPPSWSFFLPAGPVSFTATHASPAVFTFTPTSALTSLANGTELLLAGGSLPGGFAPGSYFVVSSSGYTFSLAATAGSSPLASTSSGSGSASVSSVYLSSLSPVSSVTTMAAYMPLPSGSPVAGAVPVAQGTSTATAWSTAVLMDETGGLIS